MPTVLWWGRFDPGYSRNRILRGLLGELGWQVSDFHPKYSSLGDLEARWRRMTPPDLLWVPCFRQRDVAAASRWALRHGVPLLFDPLISAYDKQVDERGKLPAESLRARRLLAWERALFDKVDKVLADTPAHADYFAQALNVPEAKVAVVYVGAEEALFTPRPPIPKDGIEPLEVLFYGSFIPLQGPDVVIEAARRYKGPPVRWTLLGQGPLRQECEAAARGLPNVAFEDWLPYEALPERIHRADILLGIFGSTAKAGRVIPNKVYQAIACGRPVVTRASTAYPEALLSAENAGLAWVPAGDAQALADRVVALAAEPGRMVSLGEAASKTSQRFFSREIIRRQLHGALDGLMAER